VLSVRLNWAARSAVIEYDRERISPELLQELATTRDAERAAAIAEALYLNAMAGETIN